jgi:hypothetical protein
MVLERDVNRVRVVIGSYDPADISKFGHVTDLLDLAPGLAAVFGNLKQPIVSADINKAVLLRRFVDRRCVPEKSRRLVLRDRIHAPDFTHHRQPVAVETARKIAADYFPGVATIVTAIELVRSKVEARVQVRADDERRIPVPAQRVFAAAGLRLNADALTRGLIKTR